jgi:hypothetical protein
MYQRGLSGTRYTIRQTKNGGIEVEPSMRRQFQYGGDGFSVLYRTFSNATETTKPSMIPKAVHICHIIVSAPLIVVGAHSAAYTGVVLDFAPTAKPSAKRAMRRLYHESAAACQIP